MSRLLLKFYEGRYTGGEWGEISPPPPSCINHQPVQEKTAIYLLYHSSTFYFMIK